MFRKILGMFAVVVALTVVFAVTASAASYWEEDFSDFDPATDFYADGTSISNVPQGETFTNYSRTVEDGALKIVNGATSGAIGVNQSFQFNFDINAATDVVFQYDIKFTQMDSGSSMLSYIKVGGANNKRSTTKIGTDYTFYGNSEAGRINENIIDSNWYTYVYHFKKDSNGEINGLDVYRKLTSASSQPTRIASLTNDQISGYSATFTYDTFVGPGVTVYFDNIKCYTGNTVKNGKFKLDGVLLEDTNDLANGTITAEAEVVLGELKVSGTSFAKRRVRPYFVAFDSEGKMVGCESLGTFSTQQLVYGENTMSFDIDASGYGASANGGYLGFYILDTTTNYRAFVDPVELTAAE